jgi:hypothetical protein
MKWAGVLLFLAAPFWETKAPADWTDDELQRLLTNSPWAQIAAPPANSNGPGVQTYLATAAPMEQAERERDRRILRKRPLPPAPDPLAEEYRVWLEDNRTTQIVLAVNIWNTKAFSDNHDVTRMEEECLMRAGRRKFKMTGHFPPSPGDPYLRLAFPRQVESGDKTVSFDLYLPGVAMPFRTVEFIVKDMFVKGKLEL